MDKGGVAVFVRKNLKHEVLPTKSCISVYEYLSVKIFTVNNVFKLISIYFPGINSPYVKAKCLEKYRDNSRSAIQAAFRREIQLLLNDSSDVFICGDFNSRHSVWNCLRNNSTGVTLHDVVSHSRNVQLHYPSSATYIPRRNSIPSTLDLLLTNNQYPISNLSTLNNLGSDHLPVTFQIKTSQLITGASPYFYDYKNANWQSFRMNINRDIDLMELDRDVSQITNDNLGILDSIIEKFNEIISRSRDIAIPKKPIINIRQTPLPEDVLLLKTVRNRIRRRWIQFRQPVDRQNIKILNKTISIRIKEHVNKKFEEFLTHINESDIFYNKKLWKISKQLRNKGSGIPILKKEINTAGLIKKEFLLTDQEKAHELADTFIKAHAITQNYNYYNINQEVDTSIENLDLTNLPASTEYVKPKTVKMIIKSSKNRKAPGFDNVTNIMLKRLPRKGFVFLSKLFTSLLRQSYFPKIWKKSKLIAIPKPGKDPTISSSYRPISLLSAISKIFEKILLEKVQQYINENHINSPESPIIPNHQFGFRTNHSCDQQVNRLTNYIKTNRIHQKSTGMIALDVEKAFDSIWHDGLCHKLSVLGFPKPLIKTVRSFLSDRSFQLVYKSAKSNDFYIPAGVPQGSVLSPTLFSLYIADIPTSANVEIANFADDTIIYTADHLGANIIRDLEEYFLQISNFFKKWKIKINNEKTKSIYFTRKKKSIYRPHRNLIINNTEIVWNEEIKYLGITLDSKLIFRNHVSHTIKKCNKFICSLYSLLNKKSVLSKCKKILLYKNIVQQVILYGCPNWGACAECYYKTMQIKQNKILKMIMNKPHYFSTNRLHEITNVVKIKELVEQRSNKFIQKIQTSDNPLINSLL